MNLPIGIMINSSAIITGSTIGFFLGRYIPERVHKLVFSGLGLSVITLGVKLTMESNFIIVMGSLIIGGIAGELFNLNDKLMALGNGLKQKLNSKNPLFTDGFLTATMIFCVGVLTILGPIQEAQDGNRTLLLTKSMLDFFTSLILATTFGFGVAMSFIPLLCLQLSMYLFASFLQPYLPDYAMVQLMGAGGVMMLGVGLSILDIKKIAITNFLPAFIIVVIIANIAIRIP